MDLIHRVRSGRSALVLLLVAAFAVRLATIFVTRTKGGSDLSIYVQFGSVALEGMNPFVSHNGSSIYYSDNPPLHLIVTAALLGVWNSPISVRLFFAVVDVAVLALLARVPMRDEAGRRAMLLFYAFNPFTLVAWFVIAEDKPVAMLLVLVIQYGLLVARPYLAGAGAGVLAAYKIMGVLVAPLIVLHEWTRSRRRAVVPAALFLAVFVVSMAPWFPQNTRIFTARQARTELDPIHSSPFILLDRLGLYAPPVATAALIGAIGALYLLYLARRIDANEAVILIFLAAYQFGPDLPANRIALGAMPLIVVLRWTRGTIIATWVASAVSAVAVLVAVGRLPRSIPGHDLAVTVMGLDSSSLHAAWMLLFPVAMLAAYVRDKRNGWVTNAALLFRPEAGVTAGRGEQDLRYSG